MILIFPKKKVILLFFSMKIVFEDLFFNQIKFLIHEMIFKYFFHWLTLPFRQFYYFKFKISSTFSIFFLHIIIYIIVVYFLNLESCILFYQKFYLLFALIVIIQSFLKKFYKNLTWYHYLQFLKAES